MLDLIRRLTPEPLLMAYHFTLAKVSAFLYRHPSNDLRVIGITGTNGKSSTTQLTAQLLEHLGEKVGYTTTAGFSIAGKKIENKMKMTMPGRFYLQRIMRRMVDEGCSYAIIETSSEGLRQYRHVGINYDAAVFTNLTPEHLERHGGFQAYKKAKGRLFSHLMKRRHKVLKGKEIAKVSVVNGDDQHAPYFYSFPADRAIEYSWEKEHGPDRLIVKVISQNKKGIKVKVNDVAMTIPLRADFQQKNAITAIATLFAFGIELEVIAKVVDQLVPIPGRFEPVDLGQPFDVIVDYAYEPYALAALYTSVRALNPKRIIGLHGAAGGGRDAWKRPAIGALAAKENNISIITNEDPYEEDPKAIIKAVAKGAKDEGAKEGRDLFLIDDRAEAIDFAIGKAKKGDVVLLTAKGSELVMAVAGGKVPWSDRQAAVDALKKRGYGKTGR
jgi:UDP-N-acetylmuramoyl-L-alanyl-D-glutamate--2,6-diaminopimelate ligase